MISKLTKQQESKISDYFEKWYKIGHDYKKIDREYAKKILLEYVSIINIKPKYFFFLDSPMACELIINILNNSQLDFQLGSQLGSRLYSQLDSQLGSQLRTQLNSQLRTQLNFQLRTQLNSQLRTQLNSQLNFQLRTQLYSQLNSQLNSQLGSQLDSQLDSQLASQLRAQLDFQLGSQLNFQLGSQLYSQLNSQLRTQLGSQLESQLESPKLKYYPINFWSQSGNILSGYCAFYDYVESELLKLDKETKKIWENFKKVKSELHYFFIFKDFIFCSEKPLYMKFQNNRLHNPNSPSVLYGDGYSMYNLNGIKVDKKIVETPADKLDCKMILEEKNAEVRKEIVKKIGIKRIVKELNCEIIEKGKDHRNNLCELILLDLQDGRKRPYIKLINPSTKEIHIEGVHPDCDTLEKAWNFRNGTNEKPLVLT